MQSEKGPAVSGQNFISELRTRLGNFWKFVPPFIRAARFDDCARVQPYLGIGMNHRIEGAGPAAALDIDAAFGIAASRKRPDDIIDAGRIDIVVDDDGKAILIPSGKTLRRDQAGLLGMPWIALFDRDHGKLSRTRLVRPDATNLGHAGLLQFFPDMRGARNGA